MQILLIGSGGREHALGWKISQSQLVGKLYVAPGNGGMREFAECVDLNGEDSAAVVKFCDDHEIDLVVIGPEAPLVAGVADALRAEGVSVFGPDAKGAQLEGSKGFTKALCAKYNIPTAAYGQFTDAESAKAYIRKQGAPIVVKADGLAAGKGVYVAMTEAEALAAIDDIFGGKFGSAGASVVVEAYLEGEEASFFALCDGNTVIEFGSAQDHKRVGEGDAGPNTGGMGTYSPAPVMTPAIREEVMRTIIQPTVAALKAEGIEYKGVFFAGLMLTDSGPQLIEYNARFGDPETQVLMPRLDGDIVPLLLACADGYLEDYSVSLLDKTALCVVMAAEGYPGSYKKGTEIRNLDAAAADANTLIFHAGTKMEDDKVIATGGRVLGVTALGSSVKDAQKLAYEAVNKIDWPEGFCRKDIGWRALAREKMVA